MRAAKSRSGVRLVFIAVVTALALVACPTPFGYYDAEAQLAELAESEGSTPQAVETPIASVRPQLLGPEPADDYTALAAGETAFRSSAHYVRFETATPDARIYVVEDGEELSTADSHLYNGEPILVTGGTTRTFHFIAVKRLMYPSAAVTVTVSIDDPFLPGPSFDPAPGVYERTANESVSVAKPVVSVDGVTIPADEITLYVEYTESQSPGESAEEPDDPSTGGTPFSGTIELTGSTLGPIEYRIKAIAHHAQLGTSTVAYAEYLVVTDLPEMPEPEFDPSTGIYERTDDVSVSIVKPTVWIDGLSIRAEDIDLYVEYTVSPSPGDPAPEPVDPIADGIPFSGTIDLTGDALGPIEYRVKAVAHHAQLGTSTVAYAEYLVVTDLPEMPEPVFDPVPGTYGAWQNQSLTVTKPTVVIDGYQVPPEEIDLYVEYTVSPSPGESAPEPADPVTDGTPFTGTIELTGSTAASVEYRVKVVAHHRYLGTSTVALGVYTIVRPGTRYYITGDTEPWSVTKNVEAMDRAFGESWTKRTFAELGQMNLNDVVNSNTSFIYIDGSAMNANEMALFLTAARLGALESWVSGGGSLFLNSAPLEGGDINFGFGGVSLRYPNAAGKSTLTNTVAALNVLHPIFLGPHPTVTELAGGRFGHGLIEGTGLSSILVEIDSGNLLLNRIILAERSWGSGRVMFGGMTTTNFHSPQPDGDYLRSNILTYLGG